MGSAIQKRSQIINKISGGQHDNATRGLSSTRQSNIVWGNQTARGTKWAFTEVECEVNGEAVTYSAISFVKEKLLAGQSYELLIRPNRQKAEHPEYEDSIQDVVATLPSDGSTAPPVAPKAPPQPKPQPQTQPQIP